MAIRTLVTTGATSMNAIVTTVSNVLIADIRTANTAILGDPPGWAAWNNVGTTANAVPANVGVVRPRINQPFCTGGILNIPNRGYLQCKPGDVVAWDTATGWPVLISGDAIANGNWTLT